MTYPNGSLYQPGEPGYTPPITLTIVDSCPCDANPKWCCRFSSPRRSLVLANKTPQAALVLITAAKLTSHTDVPYRKTAFILTSQTLLWVDCRGMAV